MEEITQALALIDRTPLPDHQESLRAALDAGWPTAASTASLAEHFDRHVERARACASIAHEAANEHRHVARDLPAIRLSQSETTVPAAPTLDVAPLVEFARAADAARRAVRTDPLWRAATFLQDCAHQQKVEALSRLDRACRGTGPRDRPRALAGGTASAPPPKARGDNRAARVCPNAKPARHAAWCRSPGAAPPSRCERRRPSS
jgi:hypothetical protein